MTLPIQLDRLPLLGALLAALALGLSTGSVDAATEEEVDHVVHAGAVHPTEPLSLYMYQDYYPRALQVRRGDRVRWEFPTQVHPDQAFHTVTFADPDETPWARADEAPGTFAFDERSFFSTGCGRPGQSVCVISSTDQIVSSGTPIQHFSGEDADLAVEPFDAVIDLPEGTYRYFCTIHHPAMQGTVEVIAADAEADNPAPEDFADLIAELTAEAHGVFADLSVTAPVDEDGARVWTVHAGGRSGDEGPVSLEAFLPASLEISAGDSVRWVMGDSAHAIMFPDTGPQVPLYFAFNCEFDEPDRGAPGVPQMALPGLTPPGRALRLPHCPSGATIELALTPLATNPQRAPGAAVVSQGTFHNSGILVDERLPERMRGRPTGSGQHFPSEFEATFPVPGTYTYRCPIHWGFMGGSITVK
jgi:plastocyanin